MPPALPRLSYVLLTHNREKYVRAAIESAFAQDYEGELEYIISDDCSTDRTFEIIQECVAAYKGNRRVVVTQTPRNLHLAGNTNHAVQFVTTDWIIRADDDDISVSYRCSIVGKAIAAHPGCSYIYTQMQTFTDEAEIAKEQHQAEVSPEYRIMDVARGAHDFWEEFNQKSVLHQVWSTRHFREYGDLPLNGFWVDDVIANLRCCSLGYGVMVNSVTAYIRVSSGNMSKGADDGNRDYASIIRLEKFNDSYYNTTYQPLTTEFEQIRSRLNMEANQRFINSITEDLNHRFLLCSFWRKGTINRYKISTMLGRRGVFSLLRCLPMPVFAFCLALFRKIVK